MKISVVGTGYVGLITGVGLAHKGHEVTCVDIIPEKVESINKGIPPIYEKGLESLLKDVLNKKLFTATMDLEGAVSGSDITLVCVGTPSNDDGSIDLKYVKKVCEDIGKILSKKDSYHTVVIKSTVVPGTTKGVCVPIIEKHSGKKAGDGFGVCMNPEFLREGLALEDFLNPSRHVIGSIDERSADILENIYSEFPGPIVKTDLNTAEMIKYASNLFLATKISYINEIGNLCKKLGADVFRVAEGMSLDPRISKHFLGAGIGFGGSCLPKDSRALVAKAKEIGYNPALLEAVLSVNDSQVENILKITHDKIGNLKGKNIAILGLAFKPETDDVRESPAIPLLGKLVKEGGKIKAYDPEAMENMKKEVNSGVDYCDSAQDALKDADVCLILTEWPEFKRVDFSKMKNPLVIEGRKIISKRQGAEIEGICW